MDIEFKDKVIRELCESNRSAVRTLGAPSAKKLRTRYSDLEAAKNVFELPPVGNPHTYVANKKEVFSLNLHGGARVLFVPNHNPVPTKIDVGIDWREVTAIIIIEIGDPHD